MRKISKLKSRKGSPGGTAGVFLFILLAAPFALADVADDMKEADEFYNAGNYSQAAQGYRNIIQKSDPNKPEDLVTVHGFVSA